MVSSAPTSNRWIYGSTVDLLVGCGGLYILLFVSMVIAAPQVNAAIPRLILPLLILLLSVPHYGATLLRVYQERAERRKYAVFTIYITIFLCGWFAVGTYSAIVGSVMVTLYLSWSPWHYSGQNYGLVLMFLGRRGVTVTPLAKRALWASFILSYLLALLAAHGRSAAALADGPTYALVEFIPLGIPRNFTLVASMIIATLYIASFTVAAIQLLRSSRVRDLLPSALILLSQSLWFVVPTLARQLQFSVNASGAAAYSVTPFLWMAAAHAGQYLWITSYYAKRSANWPGFLGYFRNTLLAGSLVWFLPVLIFAPYALGGMPFAAGMTLLVAALVNLHHFVLDGAIWKLRNEGVGAILIRNRDTLAADPGGVEPGRRGWLRHVVWATAGACTLILLVLYYQEHIAFQDELNRGDLDQARETLDDMAWIGRDFPARRMRLANRYQNTGKYDDAIREYRIVIDQKTRQLPAATDALAATYMKSGQLAEARTTLQRSIDGGYATASTYYNLGTALATDGRVLESIPEYRRAIEMAPRLAQAHSQLGTALVMTDQLSEGIDQYRKALAIDSDDPLTRRNLEAAIIQLRNSRNGRP